MYCALTNITNITLNINSYYVFNSYSNYWLLANKILMCKYKLFCYILTLLKGLMSTLCKPLKPVISLMYKLHQFVFFEVQSIKSRLEYGNFLLPVCISLFQQMIAICFACVISVSMKSNIMVFVS